MLNFSDFTFVSDDHGGGTVLVPLASLAGRHRAVPPDPLSVLDRGYSVTMDKSGNSLRSVMDVQSGEELQVRLEDGTLQTKVTSVKPQQ